MRIGLFTSGGDAPGMNAAIRAVVRSALTKGHSVVGIYNGYEGMLEGKFVELNLRSVANIIQRGGTILKTARSQAFHHADSRQQAAENLRQRQIEALICIGGDGSFRGLMAMRAEHGFSCIGIPGTIDNDIYGSEYSIGFDTATNTALEAIDRVRDTAESHNRIFIVEVMGKNTGFLALDVGIAGGAQDIFVPEKALSVDAVVQRIEQSLKRGKKSSILIAAEGQKPGRAYDLAEAIRKKSGFEAKVCILGHIQRGGSPTARDRLLASSFGAAAVQALDEGFFCHAVGLQSNQVGLTDLSIVTNQKKYLGDDLLQLSQVLAN